MDGAFSVMVSQSDVADTLPTTALIKLNSKDGLLFEARCLECIFCSSTRHINEVGIYLKVSYCQGNTVI